MTQPGREIDIGQYRIQQEPYYADVRGEVALFTTAVPEYADYNTAVVAIEGTVDMASGTIDVAGRALTADRDEPRTVTTVGAS